MDTCPIFRDGEKVMERRLSTPESAWNVWEGFSLLQKLIGRLQT